MKCAGLLLLSATLSFMGCSSSDDTETSSGSGGDSEPDCTFVTEADLLSSASITASKTPRDPSIGAGSTCNGNFVTIDAAGTKHMVLLIANVERSQFDNPDQLLTDTYKNQEQPTDLGAGVEAKLFTTDDADGGAKVLWMFKNVKGFELVTFFKIGKTDATPQLTKAQTLALGKIAATRF